MFRIKKLDLFILKSFLTLFAGTFFICLFIFMMQFLWRFVDDLVGKGLELSVMAQFFFYSILTLIPLSLPLAVLLASLITFGNFGERYELLSMKAAGISLIRIMRPLIIFAIFTAGASFYFQNIIAPHAQLKLYTLLISMKQKSPELDIPEGAFYDEIEGINIYVKHKNRETGMMYKVTIYNFAQGFDKAQIIVADSGRLEMAPSKKYLTLHLYNGEQFENLKSQSTSAKNVPYRRESFAEKHTIIDFDADFNMLDEGFMRNQSVSLNMWQLQAAADSMHQNVDSIAKKYYKEAKRRTYKTPVIASKKKTKEEFLPTTPMNIDSLYQIATLKQKEKYLTQTLSNVSSEQSNWQFKSLIIKDTDKRLRRHGTEWHKKITTSLACIIFFFIGAPLGGIIRKGGIGMPVVVSVLIFIVYYIIDNTGYKMARDGNTEIVIGMWISTFILAPVGFFLTYKSNNDSVVFNLDAYLNALKRIVGIRLKRHVVSKEVVIEDASLPLLAEQINELTQRCETYHQKHKLLSAPNYIRTWKSTERDSEVASLSDLLEKIVEHISCSKNATLINIANKYPFLSPNAHKSPLKGITLNTIIGFILPLGLPLYIRVWIFRIRLRKDIEEVIQTNKNIQQVIHQQIK